MGEFYFRGIWRMDWGLGNPNKTATLIAMLMIAVWGVAYVRRWGFWAALLLFTGLGICLVHTFSRGGLVALLSGLGMMLWKLPRPWPASRILGVIVATAGLSGTAIYLQAHDRFGQGIAKEDRSITNRLKIWKEVPRMMADAPAGWGHQQASRAFMQWYQPADASEAYLNLVNSHLNWMVELNWFWRFCYLSGWGAILVLCWPAKAISWLIVPFGIWTAFAVGSTFTHVAESYWMWLPPGAALVTVLVARLCKKTWPPVQSWSRVAGTSAILLIAIWVIGSSTATMSIRGSAKKVIIGRGKPEVWVVADPKILGENYGKTFRRFLSEHKGRPLPTVAVVSSVSDIEQSDGCTLVVSGSLSDADLRALATRMIKGSRTLLLNPAFHPQEVSSSGNASLKSVTAFFGEFSQSPAISAWSTEATVQPVEAAGDFLPRWPELIFR